MFKIHHHPFWHMHIKSLCFLSNSAWSLKCYTFFMLNCKSIQFQHTRIRMLHTQTCAKWDFVRLLVCVCVFAKEKNTTTTTTMAKLGRFWLVFANDFSLAKCSNVFVQYKLQWLLRMCLCVSWSQWNIRFVMNRCWCWCCWCGVGVSVRVFFHTRVLTLLASFYF